VAIDVDGGDINRSERISGHTFTWSGRRLPGGRREKGRRGTLYHHVNRQVSRIGVGPGRGATLVASTSLSSCRRHPHQLPGAISMTKSLLQMVLPGTGPVESDCQPLRSARRVHGVNVHQRCAGGRITRAVFLRTLRSCWSSGRSRDTAAPFEPSEPSAYGLHAVCTWDSILRMHGGLFWSTAKRGSGVCPALYRPFVNTVGLPPPSRRGVPSGFGTVNVIAGSLS